MTVQPPDPYGQRFVIHEEPPKKNRGAIAAAITVGIIVLALVIIGSLLFFGWKILGWGQGGGESTAAKPSGTRTVTITATEEEEPTSTTSKAKKTKAITSVRSVKPRPTSTPRTTEPEATAPKPELPPPPDDSIYCDPGVWSVTESTSCEFSREVAYRMGVPPVSLGKLNLDAWSPVTGQVYRMHCERLVENGPIWECRGGTNAVVWVDTDTFNQ